MVYDLGWDKVSYDVNYIKGGKTFPLKITLNVIPSSELQKYDKSLARPYRQEQDGGTTMNLSPSEKEIELFDKYFVEISKSDPALSREALLAKIPQAVKRSTIRDGVGGVSPEEKQTVTDATLDDILSTEVGGIKITATANGLLFSLTHVMAEPEAEDELAYRRATVGALKSLPGRRRQEFLIVEDFSIYEKLYDKLVQSVEGYAVKGDPVLPVESVRQLVPYYHKKAVVRELFGSAEIRQEQEDNFF